MRLLWLTVVALAIPAVAGAQPAEQSADQDATGSGTASVRIYADDDHMTVVSPRIGARVPVSERIEADFSATADVVSGASIDVVSEASPLPISERRMEGGAGATVSFRSTWATRVRAVGSYEDDYRALGGEIGARVELAQRNTVIDVALSGSLDSVGRSGHSEVSESRRRRRATTTLSQIVDPRTVIDVVVEGSWQSGYLESPYRTVPLINPVSPELMRLPEEVPDRRLAAAAMVRLRRALGDRVFARASYRLYRDEWSVTSHTGVAGAIVAVSPRLRLGGRLRGYAQSSTDFYQPRYELVGGVAPELRTRDRRLGRMRTLFATGTADVAVSPRGGLRLVGSLGLMRFWWPDFPAQTRRSGYTVTLGATRPF